MAYAILPALMLCMHRFFNKINNIQILLHNIRISLHVGNTHPIIVSAINNKVLLLLILRKYLNLYLVQSVIIDPILLNQEGYRIFGATNGITKIQTGRMANSRYSTGRLLGTYKKVFQRSAGADAKGSKGRRHANI